MATRLCTLLLALLLLLAAAPLRPVLGQPHSGASSQWVAADQVPLRSAPSIQGEVLLRLARGAAVRVLQGQGSWTQVQVPGGRQGWLYQGHLAPAPPPPALGDPFEPLPGSLILAEAADTSRSNRSHAPARAGDLESLRAVLDQRYTPEMLEEFLSQGGIGEYSRARAQSGGATAWFPALRRAAPLGGQAEQQVGFLLAARVVRSLAQPVFGNALQRYVTLVGLAVARFAPGQAPRLRAVVLDLPGPVCFSLPGGLVFLSTGLLDALENEAQLALLLAHETAHVSLGHLWSRALGSPFFRSGGQVDAQSAGSPLFAAMLDEQLDTALSRGYAPHEEFAADAAAVQMAFRAGYDPQQLPRALVLVELAGRAARREARQPDGRQPDGRKTDGRQAQAWPGLHPPTSERLTRLQQLLGSLPQDGLALATLRFQSSR